MKLQEKIYGATIPRGITAIMGADIGGTNSNFGIFERRDSTVILLLSLHAKSQEITSFPVLVKEVLELVKSRYEITIHQALFACAGVVSSGRDRSKPTNLSLTIDAHEIKKATGLSCVSIANDFEVIGYGLSLINPKDIVPINAGVARDRANKAILGAGTGLGKCIMFWSERAHRYVPVASEGGHADCALYTKDELALAHWIQKDEERSCPISWEDLLSGDGIRRMYRFFHATATHDGHSKGEEAPRPDEIFKSRTHDVHSAKTFELYTRLYARCAKNFALDALALGGMYVAGGIAAHNLEMFQDPAFMKEFGNCGKQAYLLKEVPLFIITDYNVSLYGAAHYLILEELCR